MKTNMGISQVDDYIRWLRNIDFLKRKPALSGE
jgi:hypothetical protein